ncbi:MAG: hypothetical protein KAJ76_04360, partial [Candidatus Heimdallarchaeota archaeon]|nr:hypothetical protein [Candidatus Heimdallarchaeota archaeon]
STKELPNSTKTILEIAIEGRANHDIRNLKLEVVLIQSFDTSMSPRYVLPYNCVPLLNLYKIIN